MDEPQRYFGELMEFDILLHMEERKVMEKGKIKDDCRNWVDGGTILQNGNNKS